MAKTRLSIMRDGIEYVLKCCTGCGDEWYARRKQNKCSLCGSGLAMRTPENEALNWDEINPEQSSRELRKFIKKAGLRVH